MKEIEELKYCEQKDGKLDLTEDDGLEYLVKLADELWPGFDRTQFMAALWGISVEEMYAGCTVSVCNKVDKKDFYIHSEVPHLFQLLYKDKQIDTSPLNEYLEDRDIQNSLDAFGLDCRKFWFLCLAVKWLTSNYEEIGTPPTPHTDEISSLINKINEIVHKNKKTDGLTLKIEEEKHALKITNTSTLEIIGWALSSFLDENKHWLNIHKTNKAKNVKCCHTKAVAYFTAVMDYFLEPYNKNPENRKTKIKYYTRDLIAWMIYTLSIDRTAEYVDEGREYLRRKISKYIKDVDPRDYVIPRPLTFTLTI